MNEKRRNVLRKNIEDILGFDKDAWITAAFNSQIEQYKIAYLNKNGKLPEPQLIDDYAALLLKENWDFVGEDLYKRTTEQILLLLEKNISRYLWKQKFSDRTLAVSILTASLVTLTYIAEKISSEQNFNILYGTITGAITLSAIFSLIFALKIVWQSIDFQE